MSAVDAWAGAALPVVVLTLVGLAAWRGPGTSHGRVRREGGTILLGERLMHLAYAWIDGLAALAVRAGVGADPVSWLSLGLGLAAGVLVAVGWLGVAAWALALSGLCDALDGAIARRAGTSSPRGAVLDSALDRYVEFFFCTGLVVWFRGSLLAQVLVVTALFGGFMITYSTAKAEALRIAAPRGWMKRAERMVWLTGGAALAAAAGLWGWPTAPLMLGAVGVMALFAHAGAIVRLRALAAAARAEEVAARRPDAGG